MSELPPYGVGLHENMAILARVDPNEGVFYEAPIWRDPKDPMPLLQLPRLSMIREGSETSIDVAYFFAEALATRGVYVTQADLSSSETPPGPQRVIGPFCVDAYLTEEAWIALEVDLREVLAIFTNHHGLDCWLESCAYIAEHCKSTR